MGHQLLMLVVALLLSGVVAIVAAAVVAGCVVAVVVALMLGAVELLMVAVLVGVVVVLVVLVLCFIFARNCLNVGSDFLSLLLLLLLLLLPSSPLLSKELSKSFLGSGLTCVCIVFFN